MLEGPTALALVHGDAALAAKALNDTARALNILEFKGGLMDGSTLSADDVRSIARLPSREVLNAQLVGTIAAPLTGLVRGAERADRRARDPAAGDRRPGSGERRGAGGAGGARGCGAEAAEAGGRRERGRGFAERRLEAGGCRGRARAGAAARGRGEAAEPEPDLNI